MPGSDDGGDETLEALLDIALDRPARDRSPTRAASPAIARRASGRCPSARAERRRSSASSAADKTSPPGRAARPERRIAKILAQHQQAFGIGFDAAIVLRQPDQQPRPRRRASSAPSRQAPPSSRRAGPRHGARRACFSPALLLKRCTSVAADRPHASAERCEGQRLRAALVHQPERGVRARRGRTASLAGAS